MSYSIEILQAADKFLNKLSKQQPSDAEAIEEAIEALGETPRSPGCRSLKGYSNIWRIRVGNYRVCYQVDERDADPGCHDQYSRQGLHPSPPGSALVVVRPVGKGRRAWGPPSFCAAQRARVGDARVEQRRTSLSQFRARRGPLRCGEVAKQG